MHLPASRCSLGVLSSLPTRSGLSCTPAATWRIHPRPAPPPLVAIVSKKPQAAGSRSPSIHNEYITPSTPRPPSALLHLHIVHRSLDDASNPSATASSPSLPVPCDGGHQSQAPALQQLPLAQSQVRQGRRRAAVLGVRQAQRGMRTAQRFARGEQHALRGMQKGSRRLRLAWSRNVRPVRSLGSGVHTVRGGYQLWYSANQPGWRGATVGCFGRFPVTKQIVF